MDESRPVETLMVTGCKWPKEDNTIEMNETQYRLLIGKLQYVVHNRPNIALVIGIVARFSSNPENTHMMIVKRIFIYLKGIDFYGLWYKKEGDFELRVNTKEWVANIFTKPFPKDSFEYLTRGNLGVLSLSNIY